MNVWHTHAFIADLQDDSRSEYSQVCAHQPQTDEQQEEPEEELEEFQ